MTADPIDLALSNVRVTIAAIEGPGPADDPLKKLAREQLPSQVAKLHGVIDARVKECGE